MNPETLGAALSYTIVSSTVFSVVAVEISSRGQDHAGGR